MKAGRARTLRALVGIAAAVLGPGNGLAAAYPARPVTLVVAFTPGGPTDKVARALAGAMGQTLGRPVLVENQPGVGGTLGASRVAKALPDGYTLLLGNVALAAAPALYRDLRFKPLVDFEPLGLVNEVPMVLVGNTSLEARNFSALRSRLKAGKPPLNIAHAGIGSASHLCSLLLQQTLGMAIHSIAYRGTAPAMADLIGGQVDLMCDQTTSTLSQIENGNIRAFAVTAPQRLRLAPLSQVPPMSEVGLNDFQVMVWHGLYAPKGTPPAVAERLNAALKAALKNPRFIAEQESLGARIMTDGRRNPEEHRRFMAAQVQHWESLVSQASRYVR